MFCGGGWEPLTVIKVGGFVCHRADLPGGWGETAGNLFGGVGAKVCLYRVAHLQPVCGLNTRVTQM